MKNHNLIYILRLLIILSFLISANTIAQKKIKVESPNKNISVEFSLENRSPFYKLHYKGKEILKNSQLGFSLKDAVPIKNNLKIVDTTFSNFSKMWQPVWGTEKTILSSFNQVKITLQEITEKKRKFIFVIKAFDDGIGFRYEFPEQPNLTDVTIIDELTEFALTENTDCWWIPGDYDSYEYLYNNTKLSEIDLSKYNYPTRGDRNHPNNKAVNTPLTMKTKNNIYLSFHEANLTDYAGLTLEIKNDNKMEVNLVPWADGSKVKTKTPFKTPWRTIQIAEKPENLLNSNLILNLNEPNKLKDVSWIEPMKYIGIWWEMHIGKSSWSRKPQEGSWSNNSHIHGANTENAKAYIDFAAKNNIKGVLIEGWNTGWEDWGTESLEYFDFVTPYPDFDLEEIVQYAKEKGVEIIGHHETGGQALNYEKHLENAFKLYNRIGIKAVKTGYAGTIIPKGEFHHGQLMVKHYRQVLETAAKYRIMIDAHEPIAATGLRRTYPNMMTREGVRGMEWNAWSTGNTPEHTTIIPFTRMLSGPIDYTPGIFDITFDKYRKKERVHTTLAKQLALFVILYSPLQMAADLPENYKDNSAFQFIKEVPVNWEESKYLRSQIGDFVTIARKNKDNWYLGSITDEFARILHYKLDFLDKDKKYKALIFKDGKNSNWEKNPTKFKIEEKIIDSKTILRIALAKGGGQAIILKPLK